MELACHSYGEDSFVAMFGGLHLEMGMWTKLGDYLACSGWTTALELWLIVKLIVFSSNQNSSCTPVAIEKLQKEAFQVLSEQWVPVHFWGMEAWHDKEKSYFTLNLVLILKRAHHEKNFSEALDAIVWYFNHYNYARWVAIHICDIVLTVSITESSAQSLVFWIRSSGKDWELQ